jgi:ATP-dependent Lhr-like helicase
MHTDRGQQILCQLERLRAVQAAPPRRIGLSATLGDPEGAQQWLMGNSDLPVTIVNDIHNKRTLELALWHFTGLPPDYAEQQEKAKQEKTPEALAALKNAASGHNAMLRQIFTQTQQKKSIIFTNSRGSAEMVIGGVREIAQQEHAPDIYHVHHGHIAAPLRAAAESAMQAEDQPACVAATVTLELGIDIGRLDQVLQLDATHTVASFVQRLGRAGRREGTAARMLFYHEEEPLTEKTHPGKQFPWSLLQTIAIIQLYIEEKWVEPAAVPKLPFSLLFHQTLSFLTAFTELTPPELAQRVLTLPPFKGISQEQYRTLLQQMLADRFLERAENGKLIVGLNAEKMVNNYRFYAVFPDEEEYRVRDGTKEIGAIQSAPEVNSVFRLAGFGWKVLEVDQDRHLIKVERSSQRADTQWTGGAFDIHDRVVARVRQVLTETETYGYLQPAALERLRMARKTAAEYSLAQESIVTIGGTHTLYFPWKGSRAFRTLELIFQHAGYKKTFGIAPYFIEIEGASVEMLKAAIARLKTAPPTLDALTAQVSEADLLANKFDRYIPLALRREAYSVDHLVRPETLAD